MTINPRDHPSDKVSKHIQLVSYSRPWFTISGGDYCIPFLRVVRITEGVSATANKESEEEKLRKLCGYSVNAVRLPLIIRPAVVVRPAYC